MMISVIIPCYNCASFIKRAVTSVLNQEFQDYELILIDNRSTDGTIHILNHYKEKYPEKVSVYHEYIPGAPAARNKGLSVAGGEWIQFLDADDELHPEKLARQAELAKGPGTGIVVGNYIIEAVKGRRLIRLKRFAVNDAWKGLITSNLGITSSNLWRRAALLEVSGWDEALTSSQEYDLIFRMLKNNTQLVFDPSFFTTVHRTNNSVSKSENKKRIVEILQNRIKLRYLIKEYLNNTHQLTRELSIMIDTYIYCVLKMDSGKIPDYTAAFIQQNMLDVPFDYVLKTNAKLKLKQWFSFLK